MKEQQHQSADNNINIFLSLEKACTFLLAKKRSEKDLKKICNIHNCELSQNCTEKQIIPSKPTIN